MSESERAAIQEYLADKGINDLLYQLLENICVSKPDNPHQFIVDYLVAKHGGCVDAAGATVGGKTAEDDDEDDNDNAEDDVVSELQEQQQTIPVVSGKSRRRSAVSAESMSPAAMSQKYEKKVFEKSLQDREVLQEILRKSFLFEKVDNVQMSTLLDAMFECRHDAGSTVIQQGEEGDNFYVVLEGECQVFVGGGEEEAMVLSCGKGDTFGELALMYNAPRAATVRAKTNCVLYAVDRITFKFILMDTTITKRTLYDGFLSKVTILNTLTQYERMTVADALSTQEYAEGAVVIREGEVEGNTFFIVVEGEVECSTSAAGQQDTVIGRCGKGDYFGEIALLTARPRACTVKAMTPVKCLLLDRKTFRRVMGPLQDLLKRNMQSYNAYMMG